jgi:predicted RNA-binding Zn-ribbon protein involved in translation (DUF1610 family)
MAGERKLKVFDCPNCGAGVILRAQGQSLSVVCGSCGSIIDPSNENYKVLSRYQINAKIQPLIPFGTRGKLKGDTWEIIGFLIRKTQNIYSWQEYLLFNPFKGFRWLTEYDGHWTFVTMIKERPKRIGDQNIEYQNKKFKLFQAGDATVSYVLGEFYWRVKVGEKVDFGDYISPPQVLSAEGGKEEIVWSLGEYILPEEISTAFQIAESIPSRMGIGACQPFPYQKDLNSIWKIASGFTLLLLLIQIISSNRIFSNFIICLLLVLLPPIALTFYRSSFENRRWEEESSLSDRVSTFFGDDD